MKKSADHPIIAFTTLMENAKDGQEQVIFSNAYGLEMSVSSDWPVTILMMTPPHLIEAIGDRTDILDNGLLCGSSYTPGDGDYAQISDHRGTWVLARASDDLSAILDAGLGILLHLDSDIKDLTPILTDTRIGPDNLMISFRPVSGADIKYTYERATRLTQLLSNCDLSDIKMLVEGYVKDKRLAEYAAQPRVQGLLMYDCPFYEIVKIIETVFVPE